jgi:LmbE family N-acetylglucosaminyl deacetylase
MTQPEGTRKLDQLLHHRRVLAVVAHPDDESFGLGAVLTTCTQLASTTAVLCFTHGEASTLRCEDGELRALRARELENAARVLGVHAVRLLDYADGALAAVDLGALRRDVSSMIEFVDADLVLVFDEGGITGHADHERATRAALEAASLKHLTVVAWALPEEVTAALNVEFGTTFCGRARSELDLRLPVDRSGQQAAIACHRSQSGHNPVLRRRLQLLGDVEWLRMLNRHATRSCDAAFA